MIAAAPTASPFVPRLCRNGEKLSGTAGNLASASLSVAELGNKSFRSTNLGDATGLSKVQFRNACGLDPERSIWQAQPRLAGASDRVLALDRRLWDKTLPCCSKKPRSPAGG